MLAVLRMVILLGLVGVAVYGAARLVRALQTTLDRPPESRTGSRVDLDADVVDDEIARFEAQFPTEDDQSAN